MSLRGNFVANFNNHFVALRRNSDGLCINLGHRKHEWHPLGLSYRNEEVLQWSRDFVHLELNPNKIEALFRVQADATFLSDAIRSVLCCYLV